MMKREMERPLQTIEEKSIKPEGIGHGYLFTVVAVDHIRWQRAGVWLGSVSQWSWENKYKVTEMRIA